jgi:hypothetical protein
MVLGNSLPGPWCPVVNKVDGICVSSVSFFYIPVFFPALLAYVGSASFKTLKRAYVGRVLPIRLYAAHSLLAQTVSAAHMGD